MDTELRSAFGSRLSTRITTQLVQAPHPDLGLLRTTLDLLPDLRGLLHRTATVDVARVLVEEYGVDPNEEELKEGRTPLHTVPSLPVIMYLVHEQADINARDMHGQTPLFNVRSIPIIRYLLDRGAHVNERDGMGNTALTEYLMTCNDLYEDEVYHADHEMFMSEDIAQQVVHVFLAYGANPDIRNEYGRNARHYDTRGWIAQWEATRAGIEEGLLELDDIDEGVLQSIYTHLYPTRTLMRQRRRVSPVRLGRRSRPDVSSESSSPVVSRRIG